MFKTVILTSIMFFCLNTYGQNDKRLSKKLWEKVQSCYSMLEDANEDGKVDYDEIIDDSKNGYLKVSGSFSPCGCNCINTVGAYRTTNFDEYVFIKSSTWGCSWKKEITSSESLSKIFPIDFETDGFFTKKLDTNKRAIFYIDIDIPRKGTDTKISIKLIPFGLNVQSSKNIVFSYSEESVISNQYELYSKVLTISKSIQEEQTLTYLLNNQFEKISSVDKELINKSIGTDSEGENKEKLVNVLQELNQTYQVYNQIKHQSLILGWNRVEKKFYIKEKSGNPKKKSFREFLTNGQFWSAIC